MRVSSALHFRSLVAIAAIALGLAGRVAAAPPRRTAQVVTIDAAPVSGPFAEATSRGVRLEGRDDPIALDGIREIRFQPDPVPDGEAEGIRVRVALVGGESIVGRLASGDENGIDVVPVGLPTARIPFERIRRIESDNPRLGPCAEPGRLHPPREQLDVAYTKSGDMFAGTLVGADKKAVIIEQSGSRRTLRWADLDVLHVDERDLPAAEGLVAEIETAGGSRLVTTAWSSDGTAFAVRTRSGLDVLVPTSAITVVRLTGGRFVYASDLPWKGKDKWVHFYSDDPDLDRWYGARADRRPSGCPLRIARTTYRHGISVHSKSTVPLPLGKRFSRFEAKFGIDDEALAAVDGTRGDVTARVLADGREVWTSGGSVKGGEPPRAVGPIDVAGVETLVLEVDFGSDDWHMMDRGDWVDPVLVK